MKLTYTSSFNQQTFVLAQWEKRWYWNNNLMEYTLEDYADRESHATRSEAVVFLNNWLAKRLEDENVTWIKIDLGEGDKKEDILIKHEKINIV